MAKKQLNRTPLTEIAWYRHGGRMAIADLMWCKVHGLVSHQPNASRPDFGPHPMRTLDQMMSGTLEVTFCPDTDLFTASPSEHDYFWDVINHRRKYIIPKPTPKPTDPRTFAEKYLPAPTPDNFVTIGFIIALIIYVAGKVL